jgi:type I restriction enzyme S subunit
MGTGHTPSRSHPEYWQDCTIPWVTTEDLSSRRDGGLQALLSTKQQISELGVANSAAVVHPADTVMLSRTASVGHVVRIGIPMATTQAFVTWTCGSQLDPRYLVLVLNAMKPEFKRIAYGSTHMTIYMPDLEQLRVPVPPLDKQRRIVDFLDAETARIDALITAKQQMVRVGAARMKSYVVSTLDGTPRHPLKRQASLIDCKHRTPTYTPDGYPVVSPGDVTAGVLDLGRCHRFVDEADWADLAEGPRRPRAGDIVYSRNASVGLAALVREGQQFCMGQDVCLVRTTRPDGDGRFLTHVLNTVGLDQIDAMKVGSTFFRVNVAQIAELQVPAVSIPEQDDLVRRWDAERDRLDGLADTLTTQIGLLRERRQALITAAVTGEIEV